MKIRSFLIIIYFFQFISLQSVKAESLPSIPDSLELITFQELYAYSQGDLDELNTLLNTKLFSNPESVPLNLLRAKIYLIQDKYKAAESILLRINKLRPAEGSVNYFLSRLYAQMDSLKLSYDFMYRIDPLQKYNSTFIKDLEDDALPFFSRAEKSDYDTVQNKAEFILKNWMIKDPSPASIENEYFDKMIERFTYAYKNFFDGSFFDDRGKIFLRYGLPDERHEFPHQSFTTECWIYKKFTGDDVTFDFIRSIKSPGWRQVRFRSDLVDRNNDSFITNKFDYSNFDDSIPSTSFFEDRKMLSNKYNQIFTEINSLAIDKLLAESQPKEQIKSQEDMFVNSFFTKENEIKSRIPDVITETPVPAVPLNVDFCRFKSDSNMVKLETYIGMSLRDVSTAVDGFLYKKISLNEKIAIKDKTFYPLANHVEAIDFNFENIITAHFMDLIQFTVPEEKYYIAFEVQDKDKRFIASKVIEADNSDFIRNDLFLSDIQLSYEIEENYPAAGRFVKNGLFIRPYPYLFFPRTSKLFIYFEIYNLIKTNILTDYTISYGLAKSHEKNILEQIFTLDFSGKPGSIQFSQDYNGNKINDFVYFQINTANMDIGEYVLRVKVTDKNSSKSFIREKKFFLTQ